MSSHLQASHHINMKQPSDASNSPSDPNTKPGVQQDPLKQITKGNGDFIPDSASELKNYGRKLVTEFEMFKEKLEPNDDGYNFKDIRDWQNSSDPNLKKKLDEVPAYVSQQFLYSKTEYHWKRMTKEDQKIVTEQIPVHLKGKEYSDFKGDLVGLHHAKYVLSKNLPPSSVTDEKVKDYQNTISTFKGILGEVIKEIVNADLLQLLKAKFNSDKDLKEAYQSAVSLGVSQVETTAKADPRLNTLILELFQRQLYAPCIHTGRYSRADIQKKLLAWSNIVLKPGSKVHSIHQYVGDQVDYMRERYRKHERDFKKNATRYISSLPLSDSANNYQQIPTMWSGPPQVSIPPEPLLLSGGADSYQQIPTMWSGGGANSYQQIPTMWSGAPQVSQQTSAAALPALGGNPPSTSTIASPGNFNGMVEESASLEDLVQNFAESVAEQETFTDFSEPPPADTNTITDVTNTSSDSSPSTNGPPPKKKSKHDHASQQEEGRGKKAAKAAERAAKRKAALEAAEKAAEEAIRREAARLEAAKYQILTQLSSEESDTDASSDTDGDPEFDSDRAEESPPDLLFKVRKEKNVSDQPRISEEANKTISPTQEANQGASILNQGEEARQARRLKLLAEQDAAQKSLEKKKQEEEKKEEDRKRVIADAEAQIEKAKNNNKPPKKKGAATKKTAPGGGAKKTKGGSTTKKTKKKGGSQKKKEKKGNPASQEKAIADQETATPTAESKDDNENYDGCKEHKLRMLDLLVLDVKNTKDYTKPGATSDLGRLLNASTCNGKCKQKGVNLECVIHYCQKCVTAHSKDFSWYCGKCYEAKNPETDRKRGIRPPSRFRK